MNKPIFSLTVLMLMSLLNCSQNGPMIDKSVRRDLKRLSLPFQIDEDGDFLVFKKLSDSRKQNIYISSEKHSAGGVVYREIFSMAKEYEGAIPLEVANSLLSQNYGQIQLGFWSVLHLDNNSVLLYVIRIPITNQKNWLKIAIEEAATSADRVEQLLSNSDDF